MIIEDDFALAKSIMNVLEKYNFRSSILDDFENIEDIVVDTKPSLIILDINLPYYNGFYWCRKIRKITSNPIMIISSRDSNMDQIMALEYGADDYITKPFDSEFLIAKINSLLRRAFGELSASTINEQLKVGNIILDKDRQQLLAGDNQIDLSITELKILKKLIEKYPNSVSRDELFFEVWDENNFVEENTLNVNIRRIRRKIDDNQLPIGIRTIRTFGYQLVAEEDGR
ncbi:response regulator receiver domain protein [Anaerococcus hydrogenalis DSM 7454]|uniref:Response regulator receiver domain protein n=1 Tax=Anaerococcus hydrogenalis DSM 7454 TaxID=561177 RepID=B6WBR8_9FIRM|nr:response regulator transcription factor [Anaerococcus hydrogenalis]EEB35087.1 response regulator receiver domain protein [Anaerococcus hydrogenalis DSM 7454]